jgi:hypothetical protein
MKSIIGLSVMMITVSGCAMSTGNYCDIYQPVPTLDVGTELQKLRTDKNNAYHMEKCQ